MRWLIVTQDFPPGFTGGIASWAADLGCALAGVGESVTLFARQTGDTRAADARWPFPVQRMWGRSWGQWQGTWAALAVRRHLSANTVVLCATWPLATQIVRDLRGARLAVAFHGSDLTRLSTPPPALSRVVARAHALFPVSDFLRQALLRLLPRATARAAILPMALPDPGLPKTPRRSELVFLGRLTHLKGVDRAIRLAHRLGRPLRIIGDGDRSALGPLSGAVTLTGRLPRAEALDAIAGAAAIVLLPRVDADGSGAEGLGLCVLEAGLRGVPGIGCATGGVPEALGPGLLLSDPDHPNLEAVHTFLNRSDVYGERIRQWVLTRHGPRQAVTTLKKHL